MRPTIEAKKMGTTNFAQVKQYDDVVDEVEVVVGLREEKDVGEGVVESWWMRRDATWEVISFTDSFLFPLHGRKSFNPYIQSNKFTQCYRYERNTRRQGRTLNRHRKVVRSYFRPVFRGF